MSIYITLDKDGNIEILKEQLWQKKSLHLNNLFYTRSRVCPYKHFPHSIRKIKEGHNGIHSIF